MFENDLYTLNEMIKTLNTPSRTPVVLSTSYIHSIIKYVKINSGHYSRVIKIVNI